MTTKTTFAGLAIAIALGALSLTSQGCTQESQNALRRGLQNYTGTDGVLDIIAGDKLHMRFIKIDKMSTAMGTSDGTPRSYRYGYGYVDINQNFIVDNGEEKVYFEISDYATQYVFYENYND
ncbi:MAG: hypothetical protein ACI8TX_002216 [Hyphomicrobiaceae bacterium]|jgi:hypothetical protein